jgi:phosphomannomutase
MTDYRVGHDRRPMWLGEQDLIELYLGDTGRVLVRPSGTEPKLKVYVDLSAPVETDHDGAHRTLLAEAQALARAVGEWLEV